MTSSRAASINRGEVATNTLSECLAVDFTALFLHVFPDAPPSAAAAVAAAGPLGILARMDATAAVLLEVYGREIVDRIHRHPSDTVRGWAAFIIGRLPAVDLSVRLMMMRPFADDEHFGVREWAWMAARRHISAQLETSIEVLAPWTVDPSPRIRRFACEATRPRGVWAIHIKTLKDRPETALPILEPLRADPDRYVQDAVANWLNDAAKTQPEWVERLCRRWTELSGSEATTYITRRALRSIR